MSLLRFEVPDDPPIRPFRRYATRYEPMHTDACLAWWDSMVEVAPRMDSELIAHENLAPRHFALLIDISQTGASVALDRIPDSESNVWLRLEGDIANEWTEADIVGVTTTIHGPHLVRLAFRGPCSFETLKAAICG